MVHGSVSFGWQKEGNKLFIFYNVIATELIGRGAQMFHKCGSHKKNSEG
jgi:hypothetical protein